MKRYQYIFLAIVAILFAFTGFAAPAAHADGSDPNLIPLEGWGLTVKNQVIREDESTYVSTLVHNNTGAIGSTEVMFSLLDNNFQLLAHGPTVLIEVENGRSKPVRWDATDLPLLEPGIPMWAQVTCDGCTPVLSQMTDRRVSGNPGPNIWGVMEMVEECKGVFTPWVDPDVTITELETNSVVYVGHLDEGEPTPVLDFTQWAPGELKVKVEGSWTDHSDMIQIHTIAAEDMECVSPEEPVFRLEAEIGCNDASTTGFAELPATLVTSGRDIYGRDLTTSQTVEGEIDLPFDWQDPSESDSTVYVGLINAQLVYEGEVVKTASDSHNGPCGEDTPDELPASCVEAHADLAVVPDEGMETLISATLSNASQADVTDANGQRLYGPIPVIGDAVQFNMMAHPNSVFVVRAYNDETGWVSSEACVVDFQSEEDEPEYGPIGVRINLDMTASGADAGRIEVKTAHDGALLVSWEAQQGWMDSGCLWSERLFPKGTEVWLYAENHKADGSIERMIPVHNWAPGTEDLEGGPFAWGKEGTCHAFEMMMPGDEYINPDIHVDAEQPEPAPAVAPMAVVEAAPALPDTHEVLGGESLSTIAVQYGVELWSLIEANKDQVSNPDVINPGQMLVIPVG